MRVKAREGVLSLVGQIDHIIEALQVTTDEAGLKAREFNETVPTRFDLRGIGSLLHDFYTAVEDIFEAIAGDINGDFPHGVAWHKELLTKISMPIPKLRPAVISEELRWNLDEYLRFRHLFRNVYGYMLDWERMQPLLAKMEAVYRQFEEEITIFRSFLMRLADELA